MIRALRLLALLAALVAAGATTVQAADKPNCREGCVSDIEGGDGVIDVVYERGKSQVVPGRGRAEDGPGPGKTSWVTVAEEMAPTCYTNGRGNPDALCAPAVSSCPDGQIRFWVWHQVTTWTRDAAGVVTSVVGPWVQEQGAYCLGADDPGVPTIARVLDEVRSSFTSLPLRVQAPRADPAPTTLVNVQTAFSAGSAHEQVFDLAPLGTPVRVTARPVRWTWTWGDGGRESFDRPGTPREPDVTHTYLRAADVRANVVVEWRGTFTVGSDPTSYAISTPAFVRSAPIPVRVREARSELVR